MVYLFIYSLLFPCTHLRTHYPKLSWRGISGNLFNMTDFILQLRCTKVSVLAYPWSNTLHMLLL